MLCASRTDGWTNFGCHTSSVASRVQAEAIQYLNNKALIKLDRPSQTWRATEAGKGFLEIISWQIEVPREAKADILPFRK